MICFEFFGENVLLGHLDLTQTVKIPGLNHCPTLPHPILPPLIVDIFKSSTGALHWTNAGSPFILYA